MSINDRENKLLGRKILWKTYGLKETSQNFLKLLILSYPLLKKKKQQVDVEEENNFYADDDARFLEYKEWKRKKETNEKMLKSKN